jgi:hypothetical protein
MNDIQRLAKNLIGLALIGGLVFLVYWMFFKKDAGDYVQIDETPIHIEAIRAIAEISTVNYKDEVVMDSVVRYTKPSSFGWEQSREIYDKLMNGGIKRRLTLIVKGEVRFGVDLTLMELKIRQTADSIFIKLPQPKIIDVVLTPHRTEIFQEIGSWSDRERRGLEAKAKEKLIKNAKAMNLNDKTEKNMRILLGQMIRSSKKLIITFEK